MTLFVFLLGYFNWECVFFLFTNSFSVIGYNNVINIPNFMYRLAQLSLSSFSTFFHFSRFFFFFRAANHGLKQHTQFLLVAILNIIF